jgi:hypothetical protein
MARDGINKNQLSQHLWENASIPFSSIDSRRKDAKTDEELMKESPNVSPGGKIHLSTRPEDIKGDRLWRQAPAFCFSPHVDGAKYALRHKACWLIR